jgi:outer membrane lipoprotein
MPQTALPCRLLLLAAALQLGGCSSPLSRESLRQVTPNLPVAAVLAAPEKHVGQTIVVTGNILRVENNPQGTVLEVLAYPPTRRNVPDTSDPALGRVLLSHRSFLDPIVYAQGREVTAVARVRGEQDMSVGQAVRREPVLDVIELQLLPVGYGAGTGFPIRLGVGVGFGF